MHSSKKFCGQRNQPSHPASIRHQMDAYYFNLNLQPPKSMIRLGGQSPRVSNET